MYESTLNQEHSRTAARIPFVYSLRISRYLLPTFDRVPDPADGIRVADVELYKHISGTLEDGAGSTGFKGATVLDAKRGYYTDPVAVLDFASLYPSIMQVREGEL
jgi:hypothetical protein